MLFRQVADDRTRLVPRIRVKSERGDIFSRNRRQLEKIADENYLQSAERLFFHKRPAPECAQHTVDTLKGRGVKHGYFVDNEYFRVNDASRRFLAVLYHFYIVVRHLALNADAAP